MTSDNECCGCGAGALGAGSASGDVGGAHGSDEGVLPEEFLGESISYRLKGGGSEHDGPQ